MPLQNRVTPFGQIVAVSGHGTMMGNRGVLHDDHRRIVRPAAGKRWITCLLRYRGRRRAVMEPRRYTQLFFLDEATAFAAGHRPCAECRNEDYKRFRGFWQACFGGRAGADDMDAVLDTERGRGRSKPVWQADIRTLPDGVYVCIEAAAYVLWRDELVAWGDTTYGSRLPRAQFSAVDVLTPQSIAAVFAAGYITGVHPSL
ncbi:MAG TPA: hypothetical protein VFE17_08115 [Candidatus Baltobacteraceae bacterium]|jgi:hypothetical protein|nr:hypothetical protein [Candidatus Baltobacteraceae bacterium]